MNIQAAFEAPGRWYRGNLHTHTSASDGDCTVEQATAFYRNNGYDFVAITDHCVCMDVDGLSDAGFLVLHGMEVNGSGANGRDYHVVGLGGRWAPNQRVEEGSSLQGDIDCLRERGALVVLAHPYWLGQPSTELAAVSGAVGLEVYNAVTDVGYFKGYSNVHWDDLLAAGQRIWGFAVDDAHWKPWRKDAGLGWVMAKSIELTAPAIMESLRLGRFYATTGPTIEDFRVDGDEVSISCSPVASINAIGERWFCRTAQAGPGKAITEACLKLWEGQTYVRAEVVDRAGKRAWSNPIFLADA